MGMDTHRCDWANDNQLERIQHNQEWGIPIHDDRLLFEILILTSAQSGLSWTTILNKHAGYLEAFDNFEAEKIATYSEDKIQELIKDTRIVRHRLKIRATVENAKRFLEIQKEFGSFDQYIWSFVGANAINNTWENASDIPTSSIESVSMSDSLRRKGFKFVGPTTCYAYMQAIGMINDYVTSPYRCKEVI